MQKKRSINNLTNKMFVFLFSSFYNPLNGEKYYRGAGVERTSLDQHLTKKSERDLGNFLMAST